MQSGSVFSSPLHSALSSQELTQWPRALVIAGSVSSLHSASQPSPGVVPPSSQPSPPSLFTKPSPQTAGSQLDGQASASLWLPSSQSSPSWRKPSPQLAALQVSMQASVLSSFWSSQSSMPA